MITATLDAVTDFAELGRRWRELETRAHPSFFQSWTWIGCLVAERFPDPILVNAAEDGRTLALGLFNRRVSRFGTTLYLHESGISALDCPYIEQNGILAEAGREQELAASCLKAAARRHCLVLSALAAAAVPVRASLPSRPGRTIPLSAWLRRTLLVQERKQVAPQADLGAARRLPGDILAGCSANTRQQVRRSDRFFARYGPLRVTRAEDEAAALQMLDEMSRLHQASWQVRGEAGCFAQPFFLRFHTELIRRGLPRGEIALLRVTAGELTVGILYNFIFRGRMLAYQSGFARFPGASQAKPGLSTHCAAMRFAQASGLDTYDFLAGPARYKLSLADGSHAQYWVRAGPVWSPRMWATLLRTRLARIRNHRLQPEPSGQGTIAAIRRTVTALIASACPGRLF